ncbi:MAG: peptidoglycan-binding protein [Bacteroidales bacterium]|nr:peptidoglycan-binding protein [Anaerotignum sp.]MCI5678745.1 peptidoglycan-binding protein [Bacteroidales bacterium]MDY3927082.1 peptidoglycan-binding protein [Anaerotignum sp.]
MALQQIPTIPEAITVHLGLPDQPAENITVPFPDYIKNVASSEIYPTWPEAAIRANIYAQISYALNRVYNEFYRSQGYDFDITNTTQYDQKFIKGRDIYENISQIVDEIFNNYVVQQGRVDPFFTAYCNGTTTVCAGLSQWGTVALAEQGLTPYQILQEFYGPNIGILENAPISANVASYPGVPLRLGDAGNDVKTIQLQLNRIADNYPAIPKIETPNGVFDIATENAVQEFQRIFNLTPDGIVGKATWYQLKYIYNGVKRLNELTSEGLTLEEVTRPFPAVLKEGDEGIDVRSLQYYLDVIAYFTDAVPDIAQDGYFGPATTAAVKAFQTLAGLPADGIVGRQTWQRIQQAYQMILNTLPAGINENNAGIYPGYFLSLGMENQDVRNLQTYLRGIADYTGAIPPIEITGIFDEPTRDVVAALQAQNGFPANGNVGPATWNLIRRLYNSR